MIISGNRRFLVIISSILSGVLLLVKCSFSDKKSSGNTIQYSQFAGSTTCLKCHKDIYEKHLQTEHFLSSSIASIDMIKGSFEKNRNEYFFTPLSSVAMEKRGDSLYQVEYINGIEKQKGSIDIVVGSGRKGQSFLSWKNNSLVQLPVTYFTPESTWSSSPGFSPQKIAFNRVVTSRCLECHNTYFKTISSEDKHPEEYDHSQIIYGISCEKCHGPAKEHVNFHTANPTDTGAKYIINPSALSRQLQLDLCALCHSGKLEKIKPSFSFQAGDKLSDYFSFSSSPGQTINIDVHGNQLGLLSSSKCFIETEMTCTSCHNVHENEKGKLEVFSQRCATCHNGTLHHQCKMTNTIGNAIYKNCIDCHMPLQPSRSIAVYLQGASFPTPAKLRTHYITVYKEDTQKILEFLKNGNAKK